jgi:signal transduction histidine kinase
MTQAQDATRLDVIARYGLDRAERGDAYDTQARLAADVLGAPIAFLTVVAEDEQRVLGAHEFDAGPCHLNDSICAHTIRSDDVTAIEDARTDERVLRSSFVTGHPRIRAYAGAPLLVSGARIGALAVCDLKPRKFSGEDCRRLKLLSAAAADLIEARIGVAVAKEADRLKGEFVSTVSHELRTPLTSIVGAIGLISHLPDSGLTTRALRLIGIASQNAERLTRLIDDLLDIDQLQSGLAPVRPETIDLGQLVAVAADQNRPYVERLGKTLELVSPPASLLIEADRHRILQVISNLVSNAGKFSRPGTAVTLAAERTDGLVRLSVADRGPGIPDTFRGRIFDRFSQYDSSDTRRHGGTGLGLSITKAIVERHGGHLDFAPRPGGGTIFFADFPLSPKADHPRNRG